MQISLSLPAKNYFSDLKIVTAYIILLVFLFNSVGYYLLFELDKLLIRKEMAAVIHDSQLPLIILRITDAKRDHDFHRTDKGEIEYKGSFYDVVREIGKGDDRVFICLHDSREEGLFAGLKKAQFHKIFLALWEHLTTIAISEKPLIVNNASPAELTFPRFSISLQSSWLQTWSPPPRISKG